MTKIIIVCWYESNRDCDEQNCIAIVHDILEHRGYEVKQYPFLQIKNEKTNYIEHMNDFILEFNPDILLFWNWSNISHDEMELIKRNHHEKVFIVFNWDDPHCWLKPPNKLGFFDISFSTCYETLNNYKNIGVPVNKYLLPAFSPLVHYCEKNHDYECDVSFMCTNLYKQGMEDRDDKILIDRYEMVTALENDPDIKFNLYGPESLREVAPKSYKGFISYEKNRLVFSNSKVNINVHGAYGDGYLNERTMTILGSGGLLMIDDVPGLHRNLTPNMDCVLIKSKGNICEQIKRIVKNYSDYNQIKINGQRLAFEKFTYDRWVDTILDTYQDYMKNYKQYKFMKNTIINDIPRKNMFSTDNNKNNILERSKLCLQIFIDGGDLIKVRDIVKLRENICSVDRNAKVGWGLTTKFLNLHGPYVANILSVIKSYIVRYGDVIGIGFGFLNHQTDVNDLINLIDQYNDRYCKLIGIGNNSSNDSSNHSNNEKKYFKCVTEEFRPKFVMSYSINHKHISWIRDNLNIKHFSSWTATQTNVDGFSGEGTILSPYYTHKSNPMIPAQTDDQSSGCIIVNTLSIDPIGCRYTEGESRWTIHPADPLTNGQSQIMLFRRYLTNRFFDKNTFNHFVLFFDANWIMNNERLHTSWTNILVYLKSIGLKITNVHDALSEYSIINKNNDNVKFIFDTTGLGFAKGEYTSEMRTRYIWTENKSYRIIFNIDDKNKKANVIDFTNYTRLISPLDMAHRTNYISGRNYKLSPDYHLTSEENEIAKHIFLNELDLPEYTLIL